MRSFDGCVCASLICGGTVFCSAFTAIETAHHVKRDEGLESWNNAEEIFDARRMSGISGSKGGAAPARAVLVDVLLMCVHERLSCTAEYAFCGEGGMLYFFPYGDWIPGWKPPSTKQQEK